MKSFFLWIKKEIHPMSWLIFILLDLLWSAGETGSALSLVGLLLLPLFMLAAFGICFLGVLLVQRHLHEDEWGQAALKGLSIGLLAAIPLSFISIIVGAVVGLFELVTGRNYTHRFGELGINYRELEKVLKRRALRTGMYGSDIRMETIINYLESRGDLSHNEARELHIFRMSWNQVHHEEALSNLNGLVSQSYTLLERYRGRWEQVRVYQAA